INDKLDKIPADLDRLLTVQRICNIIDHQIHANYKIFKTNYMAHDMLFNNTEFAEHYSSEDAKIFTDYLNSQLDKITDIPVTDSDRNYMFKYMLQMYSNPLTNQIEAIGIEKSK
ncbi:MAG: acyltransferase, partial [Muribaculaceae bacterium]|nr:acyltransferase [Muribaculaceae bacterium]